MRVYRSDQVADRAFHFSIVSTHFSDQRHRAYSFVDQPQESLAKELKEWLDLQVDEHRAKLVRALLAMRNYQFGGMIALGIDDIGTRQAPPSFDPRKRYTGDVLHALISKHASMSFDVDLTWVPHGGYEYPVIHIPGGVQSPVICKSSIGIGPKPPLREGAIYVRTLNANGIPSSALASWKDLEEPFENCLKKREMNFSVLLLNALRSANPKEVPSLIAQLREVSGQVDRSFAGSDSVLEDGIQRFQRVIGERNLDIKDIGFLDIGLSIRGPRSQEWANNERFLMALKGAYPGLSGAHIWEILSSAGNESVRPYVFRKCYEQVIYIQPRQSSTGWGYADFAVFDPQGCFFLRKAFMDDLRPEAPRSRGKTVEPVIAILRLAEAVAVGIEFAKAMQYSLTESVLNLSIQWSGLKGRTLAAWAHPEYDIFGDVAHDNDAKYHGSIALSADPSEINKLVVGTIQELSRSFGGAEIAAGFIERQVTRVLEGKL
jgi:hypothetical protein